jgi:hypothetical protein
LSRVKRLGDNRDFPSVGSLFLFREGLADLVEFQHLAGFLCGLFVVFTYSPLFQLDNSNALSGYSTAYFPIRDFASGKVAKTQEIEL